MALVLPKLYVIADRTTLDARGLAVRDFASQLRDAGVTLLQYRDKHGSPQQVLEAAAQIAEVFSGTNATLILNDRADLAVLANWSGVHVGHRDMPPAAVRRVVGPERLIGVSTHNEQQLRSRNAGAADYIAIGPVFGTATKADTEPVVGLEGVRLARSLTTKPLVAIGGVTLANARSVLDAGADSVSVIGGLFAEGRSIADNARAFLALQRTRRQ